MTVFETIGGIEPSVLCHEVGHLIVGRSLGFTSRAYIEFVPGGRHCAICCYSKNDGPLESRVIRTLAGMVVQVRFFADSIEEPLRSRIAEGKLFAKEDIQDPSSEVRKDLWNVGLDGDIEDSESKTGVIDFVSAELDGDSDSVRQFIFQQEIKLHQMLESSRLIEQIKYITSNVEEWTKATLVDWYVPPYLLKDAEVALAEAKLI